jgi:hypothetical protein
MSDRATQDHSQLVQRCRAALAALDRADPATQDPARVQEFCRAAVNLLRIVEELRQKQLELAEIEAILSEDTRLEQECNHAREMMDTLQRQMALFEEYQDYRRRRNRGPDPAFAGRGRYCYDQIAAGTSLEDIRLEVNRRWEDSYINDPREISTIAFRYAKDQTPNLPWPLRGRGRPRKSSK